MQRFKGPYTAWATGSTGTGNGATISQISGADIVVIEFEVESVGATPTITVRPQISMNNADWVTTRTVEADGDYNSDHVYTAAGTMLIYFGGTNLAGVRLYAKHYRVTIPANTNVTFRADVYGGYAH